jgi:ABC-2 type transport system permease protein
MSFPLIFADELKGFYKSKVMIFLWIGLPILAILIHLTTDAYGGAPISLITAIVVSTLGGMISSIMLIVNIINEKDQRVYDLFLIRPIKRWHLLVSKFIAIYIIVSIACFIAVTIGIMIDVFESQLLLDYFMSDISDLVVTTLSTIAISSAFGVLIGVISPSIVAGVIIGIFVGQYVILIPSIPGLVGFENTTFMIAIIGVIVTSIMLALAIILFNRKQF